jgi:K+-sensing histidine kinase KdpD
MSSSAEAPETCLPAPPGSGIDAAALLEALDAAAVVFGPQGSIQCANRQAAGTVRMLGEHSRLKTEDPELAGLSEAEWTGLLRRFFSEVEEPGAAPAPGEDAELCRICWTARMETTGFPRRVFERQSRTLHTPDGRQAGRLETLRDVTTRARAEEERERLEARYRRQVTELEARLEQIEKFKMELTANVSHDLRTPLASIKASVSGLLAGDIAYDPRELRETLTMIEEETDRLQRRVQNLLSMSRLESGDAALSRDWVDISDVVASALESLRSIRGSRAVRLDFPEDLPLVLADYDQLQIAVRNLLENAFLYSPPDGAVDLGASVSLGQLRVRVRDYGQGLMPDEFERIFDKFYRGRSARRIPGTGLGLPICRGIAEAHGGRLWAEHVPGGGVAFVLSLPVDGAASELATEGPDR